MKLARHINVLELLCSFVVDADLWLVMPLMDKGSCYYIMRSLRSRGLTREGEGVAEAFIRIILREVLQGLEYLHANGQLHRDIKAGNILVNSEGQVKLGDFGVAGWLHEYTAARSNGKANTFVGTPCWMAPEVMEQTKGYTTQVDIWSVGITALELAKGVAPYSHLSPMQVLVKTLREPSPSLDTYEHQPGMARPALSSQFSAFVAKCLEKNPEKRPSAATLLKDKYIKNAPKITDLVTHLLQNVPSVGSASAEVTADRPAAYDQVIVAEESEFAAGTTWRFPGDEQEKVSVEEVTAAVKGLQSLTQGSGERAHSDEEDEEDEDDE
jgi:serine/threonine-protein kinase OSR1/STK39